MQNEINNVKLHISRDMAPCEIRERLTKFAEADPKWYSYCIVDRNDEYILSYHYSSEDKYNTVDAFAAVGNIITAITNHDKLTPGVKIFSYEQPTIELMCEIYTPLVKSLAKEQSKWWHFYSYNDLVQQCYCTMCELYNQGYYIHKSLLRQAFMNDLLDYARKHKVESQPTVSLDALIKGSDETMSIKDVICDIHELEMRQDYYDKEANDGMLAEVKRIIVEHIGEEKYNKILSEYASETKASSSTYSLKYRLKKQLAKFKKDLKNSYYGG